MSDFITMSVVEVAKYLHIHPDTVKARARSGQIPAFMPGRKWVFYRHEVDAYLETTRSCRSIKGQTRRISIADLRSVDRRLDDRLGPVTERPLPSLKIIPGT